MEGRAFRHGDIVGLLYRHVKLFSSGHQGGCPCGLREESWRGSVWTRSAHRKGLQIWRFGHQEGVFWVRPMLPLVEVQSGLNAQDWIHGPFGFHWVAHEIDALYRPRVKKLPVNQGRTESFSINLYLEAIVSFRSCYRMKVVRSNMVAEGREILWLVRLHAS